MKSKVVFVAFLLMLFIAPMIFISSYASPAILAEPNINKDFSLSTEYEASDQSITSFSKSLADDVLFYPDSDNTLVQNEWDDWDSDSGSLTIKYNDYNATKTNTTTEYDPSASGGIQPSDSFVMAWGYRFQTNMVEVQFNFTLPSMYTSLTLNTIMSGSADSNTLATSNNGSLAGGWYIRVWNWDTSSYVQLDYKNSGLTWGYSTALDIDNADYFDSATRTVMIKYSVYASDLYVGIWIYSSSITLGWTDYTESFESFADVSDWTTSDTSISTDGDVATITENGAGSTGRAYASFSSTDFFEYYYEFRIESMTATTANLEFWDGAAYNTLKTFTAVGIYKGIIADTDAATMQRIGFLVGSEGGNIKPDYLRVGNSSEMGWQHDCSITAGMTTDGVFVSSDGDLLTVENLGTGNKRVVFNVDETTTHAKIDPDYYPFLSLSVTSVVDDSSDGEVYRVQVYSDAWYEVMAISDATGVLHCNVRAVTSVDIEYIAVQLEDPVDAVVIDWVKMYSIADYTVTQSGVGTDDYLYVSDGVLYSHIDDGYIEANHDPALSVDTEIDGMWTLTTSAGIPQSDYYVDAWAGYSSETEGYLASGTLTDFKLNFTDDANVAAITFFIAPPQWYESGEVELLFTVPIDETGLDMLLIFLGLIMIPLSTLYLVKGGRSEMSSDKLFYGLIAFTIGWALFLGGIM